MDGRAMTVRYRNTASRRRGVILVGILWLMVVCAALAIALRVHFSGIAANARSTASSVVLRYSAESVLAVAALRIRNEAARGEPPNFSFDQAVTVGGIQISAKLANEAARIDLNSAREELLIGLFRAGGLDAAGATRTVTRLLDLRGEADAREALPPAIADERVLDPLGPLTRAVRTTVETKATVATGLETVRLDQAGIDVLRHVPGLEPEVLPALRRHAAGEINDRQLQAILNASQYHTQVPAQSWRADIVARETNGSATARYRAIFSVIPDDSAGYRILDWQSLIRPEADEDE
jgi:hypothetical protein